MFVEAFIPSWYSVDRRPIPSSVAAYIRPLVYFTRPLSVYLVVGPFNYYLYHVRPLFPPTQPPFVVTPPVWCPWTLVLPFVYSQSPLSLVLLWCCFVVEYFCNLPPLFGIAWVSSSNQLYDSKLIRSNMDGQLPIIHCHVRSIVKYGFANLFT